MNFAISIEGLGFKLRAGFKARVASAVKKHNTQ